MVCAHGNCYSSIPVDLTAALLLELVWVQLKYEERLCAAATLDCYIQCYCRLAAFLQAAAEKYAGTIPMVDRWCLWAMMWPR